MNRLKKLLNFCTLPLLLTGCASFSNQETTLSGGSNTLGELRQQITATDQQLLTLLAQRQHLVLQVGHYKLQQQLPLYDPQREQQLLHTLLVSGQQQQLAADYITQLFKLIFRHSLLQQQQQLSMDSTPVSDNKATP